MSVTKDLRGGGLPALALLSFLTACRVGTALPGEDPPTLESAEALEVTTTLVATTLESSVLSGHHVSFTHEHGVEGPHQHPIGGPFVHDLDIVDGPLPSHHNLFDFDVTVEVPCPMGGSVLVEAEVTGEGNPAVQPGRVHYTMIQTHQGCLLTVAAAGGESFLFDAAPYLTVEAHATNDGAGTSEIYGSLSGSIGWQAEARGGVCQVDLSFTGQAATIDDIEALAVTGTFCDLTLNATVPTGA